MRPIASPIVNCVIISTYAGARPCDQPTLSSPCEHGETAMVTTCFRITRMALSSLAAAYFGIVILACLLSDFTLEPKTLRTVVVVFLLSLAALGYELVPRSQAES